MVGVAGRSGVGSGGPRGGGRPKGSVNSESIKLQERALASGFAPLDVLLGMMRYYYDRAQKLLKPQTSALEAVEHVLGMDGLQISTSTRNAGTFIEILNDLGFKIVGKDAKPEDADKLDVTVDRLYDKAGEHAARAASYIHPRMSSMDMNSRFDMMRLSYDERRELGRLLSKGLGLGGSEPEDQLKLEHDERESRI
jgi:hypothetical protein